MSIDEWIKKIWVLCVCTNIIKYLSRRKKGILPLVTTWLALQSITLDAINETKTNIVQYYLYEEFQKVIFMERE